MKEEIKSENKKEEIVSEIETKKKMIESMLNQGQKPEQVADDVGCSLRYVYTVKSGMGLTERPPTMKNNVAEIKGTLKDICKDVRALARSEEGETDFAVCPECKTLFALADREPCEKCGVVFCSLKCVEKHKKDGIFDDSKCPDYQKITSEVKEDESND